MPVHTGWDQLQQGKCWLVLTDCVALQTGAYIAGTQIQPSQNLSDYTVFSYADLQNHNDVTPSLGSCFATTSGLNITSGVMQQVNACMAKNTLCCYAAAANQVRAGLASGQ